MGGYGFRIGESMHYVVMLEVNCSNEHHAFSFGVYRKDKNGNADYMKYIDFESGGDTPKPEKDKCLKELEHEGELTFIKDKGVRDKLEFEWQLRQKEERVLELEKQVSAFREHLDAIRSVVR